MTGFELREEIDCAGRKYFLQTSLLQQKGIIQSSFFKNGMPFDTHRIPVDGKKSPDDMRRATKEVHLDNKRRFIAVLEASERLRKSDDPKTHLRLAQALWKRHLGEEAVQEAQRAIDKGSKESLPYMIIAQCHFEAGRLEEALEAVRTGLAISPEYPDLHNLLGEIHLERRKCRPAIESFNRAIGLNLYYGEPYLNLARAFLLNTIVKEDYELSRDPDKSFLGNLERAVQLDPFLVIESIEEAKKLFLSRDYSAAYEALSQAKRRPGRDSIDDIMLDLYLMLISEGEALREEEIEAYLSRIKEIVEVNPTFADGYNMLGILYTAKCKIFMDRAGQAFRKALEINSNYQKARKNLRLTENDRQGIFILLKALLD